MSLSAPVQKKVEDIGPIGIGWEELREYNLGKISRKLYRSEDVQTRYDQYLDSLSKQGITITSAIMNLYFKDKNTEMILVENKFPYLFTEPIKHYIIWHTNDISEKDIIKFTKQNIAPKEFVLIKNDPINGSVIDVPHYHLFVRQD